MTRFAVIALSLFLAACADTLTDAPSPELQSQPSYGQGFDDGCSTAMDSLSRVKRNPHRNEDLYKTDEAYRQGWSAGYRNCIPPGSIFTDPTR